MERPGCCETWVQLQRQTQVSKARPGHQPFLRLAALYLGIWLLEKMGLATKVNAKRV
jgi:hypothetical protein